ncbi:MAG TPA: hypothetical protein VIK84_01345 [Haloplasmataceae bacterium]
MKKIFVMMFFIAILLVITSCGPNSHFYKINKTYDVISNNAIEIDVYKDILMKHRNEFGIKLYKRTQEPEKYYKAEVEYQESNSSSFKKLTLKDDKYIYEVNPESETEAIFKLYNTYNFKIRFINTETNDNDDMINFYVTYTFLPTVEVNRTNLRITKTEDTRYNILYNIISKDKYGNKRSPDEIKDNFTIEVTITKNNVVLKDVVNYKYELIFNEVGTYHVKIVLTEKLASTDATSGATPGEAGSTEAKVYTVEYDIEIYEN